MLNQLTYKPFGAKAILIEWKPKINEATLNEIIQFKDSVVDYYKDQLNDCIIGYNSLTIIFIEDIFNFQVQKEILISLYKEKSVLKDRSRSLWKIPVCYDETFGIDLEEISESINISEEEIVQKHSGVIYTVYFIGFLPGFLYLGGLDQSLHIKRKATPRLHVEKGAVAIGGSQTGIYHMDSAGGWNIIGKTPISFFSVTQDNPCFAKAGDKIQFIPVSLGEYKKIELEMELGLYHLANEPYND